MRKPNYFCRGFALAFLILSSFPIASAATVVPRPPQVQRVYNALDLLRQAAAQPPAAKPRTITLTDTELNAYINYRIKSEKAEALRELRLQVFPKNKVEGMMFLDLAKVGAPSFLAPALHFYFSGRLMSQNARIKFEVTTLFLEYKPVPVFLLNMAFYIASKTQKHGPAGLADWYELPLGLTDITTEAGRVILHY